MGSNGAGLARASIEKRLGYFFSDRELLKRALTHGSADARSNERLEFLGDAILSIVIAEHLFHLCPDAKEGDLTRMRARIVRGESLAAAARGIGLGPALRLSPGERRNGGSERDSILAGAFEALMGAIWLDSDLQVCRERILDLLAKNIAAAMSEGGRKDPKTRLQEYLQGQGKSLPDYRIARIEGVDEERRFIVHCKVEGMIGDTTGIGSSRRRAERSAAASALVHLGVDDDSQSPERENKAKKRKERGGEKTHPGDLRPRKATIRETTISMPEGGTRKDGRESMPGFSDQETSSRPPEIPHRCGFVAVAGRPNVGKSTLLNRIAGRKFSITSRRPQTTRHRISGILSRERSQIVLVDTPGIHRHHRRALNRYMNKVAVGALAGVDLVLMIIEAPRWQPDDDPILDRVMAAAGEVSVILVINKIDRLRRRERILPMLHDVSQRHDFLEVIPISARNGENLDRLMRVIEPLMPEGPPIFAPEVSTDRGENFHIAEIVREKLIRRLGQELPHQLAVEIEHCRDDGRQLQIHALVWVARKQHKSIVIGSHGRCLKEVGIEARQAIASLLCRPVHLEIWVKVRQGWPDDERALASLGYVEER